MAEVGFDSAKLSGISENFTGDKRQVGKIKEEVDHHIAEIKRVWTGDAASLTGREKDFAEIDKNLDIIQENLATISKFLDEKNTDFSKVTYK